MKFTITKIAAGVALVIAASTAQAALNGSTSSLTIENDAVTTYGVDPNGTSTSASWYVSSNGALADSFFTMGGSKSKLTIDGQYAYLGGNQTLTLNGATQANTTSWTYYSAAGLNKTTGTGISVISASGDTAIVNMSGWKVDWNGVNNVYMGSYAWSTGFVNGQGKVTCATGSGCAAGSAYTLKYTATVPNSTMPEYTSATGFENVKYYLELHGCVTNLETQGCEVPAIPEASTYTMMLAGLGLVGGMARRRKHTRT